MVILGVELVQNWWKLCDSVFTYLRQTDTVAVIAQLNHSTKKHPSFTELGQHLIAQKT